MPIAFKEWAVTVRALAEGEQLLTLRKGGIREENKHFELEHERFFLYPTFDHQRNDLVRESHHPELRRALEEGVWPDEEPPPKALIQDGGIPQPDRVRLRAWAEVTDHVTINDRRTLDGLSPYYIWTPDYAEKRLNWKRRHPLHILLLRVHRIPRPVTVRVRDEYHGCRSWVEIDRELPFEGTPVMADEEFDRARARDPRRLRQPPNPPSSERLQHAARRASLDLDVLGRDRVAELHRAARHRRRRLRRADAGPDGGPAAAARRPLRAGARRGHGRRPHQPGLADRWPTPSCPPRAGRRRRPAAATSPAGRWRPSCTCSTTPTWNAAPPARTRCEALRGTAERLYAQLVIAANNTALPPSWTPRRFARYLRWAWLVEGGAQYFSRQVGLYRAAVIRRLRESARPSFPPSRRDAVILGGTIFDLLENERGPEACERLVARACCPAARRRRSKTPSTPASATSRTPGATTCARWPGPAASAELVEHPDEDHGAEGGADPEASRAGEVGRPPRAAGFVASSAPRRLVLGDRSASSLRLLAWLELTRRRAARGEELRIVEAAAALEHARDAGLAEQALDHFRLDLVAGEGDLDQLAAAAATAATALVVAADHRRRRGRRAW